MVPEWKPSQEYPVNVGVHQGSILESTLFLIHINDLPDDVSCNFAAYTDDTTLYSKCGQLSNLWQQLKLASEFESDLWDTMDWGRKWLIDFNVFNDFKIDVKIDRFVLEEKSSSKMLGLT